MKYLVKQILIDPKKSFRRLVHRIGSIFGQKEYKRFIILSRSRTGSNMLVSFLDSHPNIFARGEVFKVVNPQTGISHFFSKMPSWIKAAGFKIFYYHPMNDDSGAIWKELTDDQDLYVIHLKRGNVLRSVVSKKIAEKVNVWATSKEQTHDVDKRVELTPEELLADFQQTKQWESDFEKRFAGHKMMDVYYEELSQQPVETFNRLMDFMGLPHHTPITTLKKQNVESLDELIIDYPALKKHFENTEWSGYFE